MSIGICIIVQRYEKNGIRQWMRETICVFAKMTEKKVN